MQNSCLLHLKHILEGAIGNVNKVLKAELQRECVRSLSAQGHKSTPRESGTGLHWLLLQIPGSLPSAEELQGMEQAG